MELSKAKALFNKAYNNTQEYRDDDESRRLLVRQWWENIGSTPSESKDDREARLRVWNEVLPVRITSFNRLSSWEASAVAKTMADPEAMAELRRAYFLKLAEVINEKQVEEEQ